MIINNEHKKLNVPNLRFPEFQGEWKKTTIGDIADLYKGTGISKDSSDSWSLDIPVPLYKSAMSPIVVFFHSP